MRPCRKAPCALANVAVRSHGIPQEIEHIPISASNDFLTRCANETTDLRQSFQEHLMATKLRHITHMQRHLQHQELNHGTNAGVNFLSLALDFTMKKDSPLIEISKMIVNSPADGDLVIRALQVRSI